MPNAVFALVAHPWGGLAVAGAVAVLGLLLVLLGRLTRRSPIRWLGFAVCAMALVLTVGSVSAHVRSTNAMKAFPPPGKLVDVGGYRMHLQAEGDARGGPTVVWIGGSHAMGLMMNHLHKVMRQETRSILFDRPGTGWSDPGPFPRRTSREADEMATLLERAGEPGPFVVVGHSYGGLLAANFARRYPNKMSALVLADPTPPDVFLYLPGGTGPAIPGNIAKGSRAEAWKKLFGLGLVAPRPVQPDTQIARVVRAYETQLADVEGQLQAMQMKPDWATASIFEEWRDAKDIADLTVYDGELGDMPVFLVTPAGKARTEEVQAIGVGPAETQRAINFLEQARTRYLRSSTQAVLIHTPPGTTHNYPYERPELLLDVVRRIIAPVALPKDTLPK